MSLPSRPSPAMAVAVVALVASLGGNAVAAVSMTRNSVRSEHLAAGSVRSADIAVNAVDGTRVRNRSLTAADFAPGQVPAGARGPVGERGERGVSGAPGAQGPAGPTAGSASDLFTASGAVLEGEATVEQLSFSTPIAGRTMVMATLPELSVNCNGDAAWRAWLEVDGVRVPGAVTHNIADAKTHDAVSFIGVTAGRLAAGAHTAEIRIDCVGNTYLTANLTSSDSITAVVLG